MKTNIFNITALALMITSSFIAGKSSIDKTNLDFPTLSSTEVMEMNNESYQMVQAKVIDGEVLPYVNLPELEIVADYNEEYMVTASIIDGEVVPTVQLPVLDIVAN